ncbi:MAG: tRNA (adenosine(37)-N6)-dimethylallyltransferase MiaA [Patescibacteria group bacterium]
MTKILIICGPTATGKTVLAAKLVKKFKGELISADSRQVYQGMDIVTGKDRPKGVKIHGLDLVKPDEDFSVAHFVNYATTLINQISLKKKLPIIVGGTGLYLNSLINPPQTLSVKPNWQLRKKLESYSILQLIKLLIKLNPKKFNSLNHSDQNNPRRLIRAIEVSQSLQGPTLQVKKYDSLWVGLRADQAILDQHIAERVKARVKAGAITEWQQLKQKYASALPSMSGIGYRQLPDVNAWIKAEQQYCRRQLTWFKPNPAIHWFDIAKKFEPRVVKLITTWYNKL